MSKTYDNTHTGAIFRNASNEWSGSFHLHKEADTLLYLSTKDGISHLIFFNKKKDGSRGAQVAKARITRRNNGALKGTFAVKIRGEALNFCLWMAKEKETQNVFFQIKPEDPAYSRVKTTEKDLPW